MKTPTLRQVLNVVGVLLLLAIVIPFVIYAVPGVIGAEGGYVVLSGSMEPAISVGDVVIVDDVDAQAIQEGDVITYVRGGEETPTTHRVIEVLEEDGELAFRTQGDANDDPDATPVPAEQVNGKVILTFPYIGYVVEFANTPYGFGALVVVPFLLLVLTEVYSFLSSAREEGTDPAAAEDQAAVSDPAAASEAETDGDAADVGATTVGTDGSEETFEEAGDNDDTIAITRTDLRISLFLLVGIAIYSGWVVRFIQEPWSFAVAFGSGIGVLLVGGMYYLAGPPEQVDERGGESATEGEGATDETRVEHGGTLVANGASTPSDLSSGGQVAPTRDERSVGSSSRIVSGTLSIPDSEYAEVEVDSFRKLEMMAEADDDWIVDEESDGFHLVQDGVVYRWYSDGAPTADQTDDVGEAADFTYSTESGEEPESTEPEQSLGNSQAESTPADKSLLAGDSTGENDGSENNAN